VRRLCAAAALLLFAGAAAAQGPNRCWMGEVLLEGPLARVELDCGPDGRTLLDGALVAGERRTLTVPLPCAPPLGLDGLGAQPPPHVSVEGAGSARWLGFASVQPEEGWLRVPPGLRGRPRPPAGSAAPRVPLSAPLVAAGAAAAAAVLGARRRAARVLAACAGAAVAAALASRGPAAGAPMAVLEADLEAGRGVRALAAAATLELGAGPPPLRLEAVPPDQPVELAVDLATGARTVRAAGGLVRFDEEPDPAGAGRAPLQPAWFRDAQGGWTRFASVAEGRGRPEAGEDPPGWLRAGLPPGRSVLLGRAADGDWVRLLGAPAPLADERRREVGD